MLLTCAPSASSRWIDLRRGDECAPLLEVNRIRDDQPHVPINARAGIPARRRLPRIVGANGQDIRFAGAEIQMTGQFVAETDVTVRPLADDDRR